MKITEKILSLPPYISTSWKSISSIMMKGSQISITLNDGDTINIPGLEKEIIDLIFKTHAEYIENSYIPNNSLKKPQESENQLPNFLSHSIFADGQMAESSIKFGFSNLDGLNTAMQHNPLEMNAPDLPQIVLQKIGSIAKILAPEDREFLPQEVPNCNCFHCQITRAIHINLIMDDFEASEIENEKQKQEKQKEIDLEPVSDLDLQFSQWDVTPTGENLFQVTNKLDSTEHYTVYLGSPVGCNCGNPDCEHIIAALRA